MTDGQKRFGLTMGYYLSEGIKRCGEPDDYGYVILTDKTIGMVYVWHPEGDVQITLIKGEVPLAEQELCGAINFYDLFSYQWGYEKIMDEMNHE